MILELASAEPWALGSLARELAPVRNQPVIRHQLEALRDAGIREVALVSEGRLARAVQVELGNGTHLGVELSYVIVPDGTGEAERLLAAEDFISGLPFVVQPGATLVEHDVRRTVEVLTRRGLHGIVVSPPEPGPSEQVVPIRPLRPENAVATAATLTAQAQPSLFVFDVEIFAAIHEGLAADREPGIPAAVSALHERSGGVEVQTVSGWSKWIDGVEDLLEANRRLLDRLPRRYGRRRLNGASVRGPADIDSEAVLESSALHGPVSIAAGAHVADSYIGPYTCVGAFATIEGVELESCVILPRAILKNLGARLEESVVGANAQVTREFALPHVLRMWLAEGARVWLV